MGFSQPLMLIGIGTSSPVSSHLETEVRQLRNDIKIVCILKMFLQNNHSFCSFYPNRGYGSQWRLFSGNLLGMFIHAL